MSKRMKVKLVLFLSLIILASTGCTIGVKEKNNLVISSPVPIPEVAKGAPMIATNNKIPLAIINEPDKIFYKDVGGYVLVDPRFYEILIKTYNGEPIE